jgi:hypothetical protein
MAAERAVTRPFTLTPIGRLRTPFADRAACPRNGRQPDPPPPWALK